LLPLQASSAQLLFVLLLILFLSFQVLLDICAGVQPLLLVGVFLPLLLSFRVPPLLSLSLLHVFSSPPAMAVTRSF